jgi:hypothetical protein
MTETQVDSQQGPGSIPGSDMPRLGEGFSETTPTATTPVAPSTEQEAPQTTEQEPAKGLAGGFRKLLNLGKKKEEPKSTTAATTSQPPTSQPEPTKPRTPLSPLYPSSGPTSNTSSPAYPPAPYNLPSSPNRALRSPSPRLISPASSQIFERNVQEDGLATTASPAIPAHITTENHIPPVLDASTAALTDDHLDPDSVEIVMSSAHQPAAVTVTGMVNGGGSDVVGGVWSEDLGNHPDSEDAASNYGALDSADVRRLSFISFADVVHAEQADHSSLRDSILLNTASPAGARSPSPIRSPVSPVGSSGFGPLEGSPNRGVGALPGSPRLHYGHSPPAAGELTIETLSQSIRKSGSRDLTGARMPVAPTSAPMSEGPGSDGEER